MVAQERHLAFLAAVSLMLVAVAVDVWLLELLETEAAAAAVTEATARLALLAQPTLVEAAAVAALMQAELVTALLAAQAS